MKKVFYIKKGRKYIPVSEYDSDLIDAMPKGTHIIMSYPGGKSTRYNIEPNYAALIAASRVAEDAMLTAMIKASEARRKNRETKALTAEQLEAWNNLVEKLGEDGRVLEYASAHDIVQAGLEALQKEAIGRMNIPAVKNAYEQFLLMVELTKDENT